MYQIVHSLAVALSRPSLIIACLSVLLMAAVAGLIVLYPRAGRTLVPSHQQYLVDRAEKRAAAFFHHSVADQRRMTFPMVMEFVDRVCVELRSSAADGAANYLACYAKNGALIEERATVGY